MNIYHINKIFIIVKHIKHLYKQSKLKHMKTYTNELNHSLF